MYRLLVQYGI